MRGMAKLCRAVSSHAHLHASYFRPSQRMSRAYAALQAQKYTLVTSGLPRQLPRRSDARLLLRFRGTAAAVDQIEEPVTEPNTGYCSGCGVKFQQQDPDLPGYFSVPRRKELSQKDTVISEEEEAMLSAAGGSDSYRTREDLIDRPDETSTSGRGSWPDQQASVGSKASSQLKDNKDTFWQDPEGGLPEAGAAFQDETNSEDEPALLCARCYSLQHYGYIIVCRKLSVNKYKTANTVVKEKVKSHAAEAALPAFDLGKKVGQKIALQKFRTPIVLCVVDLMDFDGSLPRQALLSLLPRSMFVGKDEAQSGSFPQSRPDQRQGGIESCKLVLVCNKADLLPKQASLMRVQTWAKKRMMDGGLPEPSSVHMVSSVKQFGVKDLLSELQKSTGVAGDVWVVGAQNAGKSSLINAMRRVVGRKSRNRDVTTAPLLGTTLGMLRIDGIMTGRNRMFDTPGVPHNHQLSSRLTPDEVKLLLPSGRLVPRTFRASAGQSILIGGVGRVDVVSLTRETMYLTVWASGHIKCHYGKTEGVDERYEKMAGSTLVPPVGNKNRLEQLGPLIPSIVRVEGRDWKGSTTDVAIAGLGWIGCGLIGQAELCVWAHRGVAITRRQALVPDYSPEMQRPGLSDKSLKPHKAAKKRS